MVSLKWYLVKTFKVMWWGCGRFFVSSRIKQPQVLTSSSCISAPRHKYQSDHLLYFNRICSLYCVCSIFSFGIFLFSDKSINQINADFIWLSPPGKKRITIVYIHCGPKLPKISNPIEMKSHSWLYGTKGFQLMCTIRPLKLKVISKQLWQIISPLFIELFKRIRTMCNIQSMIKFLCIFPSKEQAGNESQEQNVSFVK